MALGIRLTDAGLGDYWDAVDAVVRNQLVEQQMIRADLLERISATGPERPNDKRSPHPNQELNEDVIRRSIGIFGGTASPTAIPGTSSMTCCTSNGTQGLYYAWEGAVRCSGDAAQVNLLLNRASKLLDVESHLPYEGKAVIRNKAARRLAVRVPFWVSRGQIRAEVAGQTRPLAWAGNYLLFDNLQGGDVITLTFPVKDTTACYTVNARTPAEQVVHLHLPRQHPRRHLPPRPVAHKLSALSARTPAQGPGPDENHRTIRGLPDPPALVGEY